MGRVSKNVSKNVLQYIQIDQTTMFYQWFSQNPPFTAVSKNLSVSKQYERIHKFSQRIQQMLFICW